MDASPAAEPPTWFWVVSVTLTLWMLMGIAIFAMDVMSTAETYEAYSAAEQALFASRPQWLFVVYGIATGSGLLGAIALLLRKAWATPVLVLSLVTVCLQMSYWLFWLDGIGIMGAAKAAPVPIIVCVLGALAVWFSMMAKRRGWLS